jgi:hypothetical protein
MVLVRLLYCQVMCIDCEVNGGTARCTEVFQFAGRSFTDFGMRHKQISCAARAFRSWAGWPCALPCVCNPWLVLTRLRRSGFGRNMADSPMVIVWPSRDADGRFDVMLSQRKAPYETMPKPDPNPPFVADLALTHTTVRLLSIVFCLFLRVDWVRFGRSPIRSFK